MEALFVMFLVVQKKLDAICCVVNEMQLYCNVFMNDYVNEFI